MDESLLEAAEELRRLWFRMARRPHMSAADHEGITESELRVIMQVGLMAKKGVDARPGAIASRQNTTKSCLSQQLKALESKGFLLRVRSLTDCRAVTLELTEAGRAVFEKEEEAHIAYMEQLLAFIGEDDIRHLTRTTRRILEFQEAYYGPDSPKSAGLHGPGPFLGGGVPPCE